MKNLYPGECSVCRKPVAVGEGDYDYATRKTSCLPCSGVRANAAPRVKATKTPKGKIAFAPTAFLGGDLFAKYRDAVAGSKYEPSTRSNDCAFDKALVIVNALQAAGFIVDLEPGIGATLQAKVAEIREHVTDASERADETDRKLRERGLSLFPFQRKGIKWLAARSGALLADEMGLGKTIQAVVALPENAPVLIVAPAVAKGVWAREIKKWRPEFHVEVLSGRGNFHWPEPGEVVILNYDILPEDPRVELTDSGCTRTVETTNCAPRTILVADEAHNLKGSRTKRTKSFRALSEVVQDRNGKVWLITATPLLNRPPELWNILQAANIAREAFGSWNAFVAAFNGYEGQYGGYEWGTPTEAVEEKLRRVQFRRMRAEVLPDLPVKTWRIVEVDHDARSSKSLDKATKFIQGLIPTAWERLLSDEDPFEAPAKPKLTLTADDLEKAREAIAQTSGRAFEEMSKARALLATAKIPAMLELVEDFEEQDEPVLVFSAHRAPIDLLAKRPGWAVITGDTPTNKRTEIEDAFQAGKLKGIGATIEAGGVAVTLTRAHQAVFVDLEFTPALNDQAEDRLVRIGQTRGVIITRLVARHPLDKAIHEILKAKTNIIVNSIDAAAVTADAEPELDLPDVDFAALEAAAEIERKAADEARRIADERKSVAELSREKLEQERVSARAEKRTIAADLLAPGRRAPANAIEEWAFQGLITLALHDPDRAATRNEVGFNGADGPSGHRLAARVYEGLTNAEWTLAAALCRKYWRQIGRIPPG